ncbi:MAG: single-stranded DNA-binding protein [Rothia sp. (in: high G+C Gram-positive bacteria)]|nr:single-stranded DNA-binding protein [Rothia sp. (in: high G+C Gram-positive bacteria)]
MTDIITVRGFVASEPSLNRLPSGTPVLNFRLASTPRWFDSHQQQWREGATNWYSVKAFKTLAQHAKASIRIGNPVLVTGKLGIKQWENSEGRRGTTVEIDAAAIGHDLNLGTTEFFRTLSKTSPVKKVLTGDLVDLAGQEETPDQELAQYRAQIQEALPLRQ